MRRRTGSARNSLTRLARATGVIAGSVAIAVCDRIVDPPLPTDAEEFSPPAVYTTWWQMTEACSALTGSMSAVKWYKTNDIVHDAGTGDIIAAYWTAGSNRVVLTSTVMMNGGIVRHEMLHALRQKGGHPRDQFLGKCAGVVDCEEACAADAGPYPNPPEAPIQVSADGIDITLDVEPNTPARNIDDGRFSITVLAHNKSTHWATVTPVSGIEALQTFAIDVHGANGATGDDRRAVDPSQRIFAPGETKKQVFDLVIGDYPFANQLLPGDYVARGSFAGWWSSDNSFTISP